MIFRSALQREFATTSMGVFIALFAILITVVLIRFLGEAAGGEVPADAVMALIGFGAVARLSIVLTLTLFIGVLLTLSRCYRDSEMFVWFASGLPLSAFVRPVLTFATPAIVIIAAMTFWVSPWAERESEQFQAELDARDDTTRVAPGVFRESAGAARVFFVENDGGPDGRLENVFVHSREEAGQISVIASSEGWTRLSEEGDRYVVLADGHRYDGRPRTPEYRVVEFERYHVLIETRRDATAKERTSTKTTSELLDAPDNRELAELAGRINAPLAALLLVLLAVPLAYVNPRAGRSNNLLVAIMLYLIYSNGLSVAQAWVAQGRVSVVAAVLLPHLVIAALTVVLFYRRMSLRPFWLRRT